MDSTKHFDDEAEKYVISSVLSDKTALIEVLDILRPIDFANPRNREIFNSIYVMFEKDSPVDYLTVLADIRKRKMLSKVGSQYIADLSVLLPTSQNALHYAKIVRECSIRRQLQDLSEILKTESQDPSVMPNDLLERAEKNIFELARNNTDKGFKSLKDLLMDAYERAEKLQENGGGMRGIPTGFVDLDSKLGGLQDSNFIVVGARPGVGKSSMMLDMATHMSTISAKKVAFFSLEMSKEELTDKIISTQGKIDFWRMRMGHMKDDDWRKFSDVFGKFEQGDIFIDDTAGQTIAEIRTKARKIKLEHGLDAIFIDYIQLILGSGSYREANRAQEVAEISRSLKLLAKELQIPVVAGSQISRGVESRNDRIPQLSDLRESGAIEQDADVVIFLHREEMYNKETDRKGIADIIIAKHRNGATGNIELAWVADYAMFANLSR